VKKNMKKKKDGYGMSLIFNNLESHKQAIYKLYPTRPW
jgi:hypothetical protein